MVCYQVLPLEDAVLGEADDLVLRMKLAIHPLDYRANQCRLVIELTERPKNPLAVLVTSQRKVLSASDT